MSWNRSDPPWQDLLSDAGVKPISHSQRYAPGTLRHCPFSQRFMFSAHSSTSAEEAHYISIRFLTSWHRFPCSVSPFYWLEQVLVKRRRQSHSPTQGRTAWSQSCWTYTLTFNHHITDGKEAGVSQIRLSSLSCQCGASVWHWHHWQTTKNVEINPKMVSIITLCCQVNEHSFSTSSSLFQAH